MTGDELPTTPGSLATDEDGQRYASAWWFSGVLRWVPVTRWRVNPLTTDELAARHPTVDYVAPEWVDPKEAL